MQSGLFHGNSRSILAILILLLAGCGHKGPLKLPPPQAQAPHAQTASPQVPDAQTSETLSPQPVK